MPELTNEDILNGIEFPHKNHWRATEEVKDKDGTTHTVFTGKNRMLVYIKRLRDLQMPLDDIKAMMSDLYWDAYVEHEKQVKEGTGKSVRDFFMEKAKAELLLEGGAPAT